MTDKAVANTRNLSLSAELANRYGVSSASLMDTIKTQVIKGDATNEQMLVVMSIMRELDLNPFNREVHAWMQGGKFQVMVGHDGWVKAARRDPNFSHVTYEESEEIVEPKKGHKCPEWIRPTLHRKDGTTVPFTKVWLNDWYQDTKPAWYNHPSHRLRMKAFDMIVRDNCGISVLDEIDAEWIDLTDGPGYNAGVQTNEKVGAEAERLREKMAGIKRDTEAKEPTVDADFEEMEPAEGASAGDTEVTSTQPGEPPTGKSQPAADDDGAVCYSPGCSTKTEAICEGCGANICPTHSKDGLCTMCKSLGPPDPLK